MAEYLIIKREVCPKCGGSYEQFVCRECKGFGYIETQVDFLTALNESGVTETLCDCGYTHWGRITNGGAMLEWTCPKTGEKIRDVNT